jgi:uncharacterized iron-regulated membrane protein
MVFLTAPKAATIHRVSEHFAPARRAPEFDHMNDKQSWWEQWLQQPQRLRLHASLFQLHFWIGAVAGAYLTLMSITGSIIVFRDQLPRWKSIEWLVKLHTNLLAGAIGRWIKRRRGRLPDPVVPDRCDHLVAGPEVLAPQSASELARGLSAGQLGLAQRVRVLVFSLHPGLGNFRILFRVSQNFLDFLRARSR